jgi:hypothetical protein
LTRTGGCAEKKRDSNVRGAGRMYRLCVSDPRSLGRNRLKQSIPARTQLNADGPLGTLGLDGGNQLAEGDDAFVRWEMIPLSLRVSLNTIAA